jgi:hypothetical protein
VRSFGFAEIGVEDADPDRVGARAVVPLWVTAPLVEEARKHPHLEVAGELRPVPLDGGGNLRQEELFPDSVRGRRGAR